MHPGDLQPQARLILSPLLVALAAILLPACRGDAPPPPAADEAPAGSVSQAPEIPQSVRLTSAAIAEAGIQTWKAQPADLEHRLVLNGSVGYNENRLLHVASNVKGRVASIPVDLGQRVAPGTPLIWIESVELSHTRDEFLKSLADLRVSRHAWERAKTLLNAKAISLAEFQAREAAHLSQQAEADTLERTLRLYGESDEEIAALRAALDSSDRGGGGADGALHRLAIRSPMAGRVIDRKVTPGSLVEALQPLLTIADLSSLWVFFQAYEKDLSLLHTGLSVGIRSEAYPQEVFRGVVDFLASTVDETTRTVRVRATVRNGAEKLRPGMFVRAQVEVPRPQSESHPVLAVPQSALQTLEGRTHVFIEAEPGVFVRRAVETGHTFEGSTEVLSGVREGDLVVTEGSFVLKGEFARAMLVEED